MSAPRLVLLTRYPDPGRAKTRLIPAIGADGAAAVHKRLAERTVDVMRESGLPIEIWFTGARRSDFADWLGADLAYVEQGGGDLGDRLRAAIGKPPVIFVGADCPDLRREHLQQAATALDDNQVVIGPAEDGGYWLIGLAARHDWLFEDMAWGTDAVLPETLARLSKREIAPASLETLSDCDRPGDLGRWPWLTP
ncbi:glycosyltransferase [Parasphingopyxis algicola]|uniref:TIGR04282 family arsenosugar biosynthesis glycosyltransferase n=1 Tax=Parasphingopyxis algicola TaxID=2026624 RepID=UPI0015A3F5EA|nr:TIGR04282 family arsenosugar biosynthesis glycosyltransferase [Parasphingopyxis algicola]QLC25085.1 glycosyltransferase [Parasphingopyxis algicola]